MNKKKIITIIVIFVLLCLMVLALLSSKIESKIGTYTTIDHNTKLLLKENKEVGRVKIYTGEYDVYLCDADAIVIKDGNKYSLSSALEERIISADEIDLAASIYWQYEGSLDDGGTEMFTKNEFEIIKYHKMLPNENPARSAVDFYEDLFIGTKTCNKKAEY